MIVTVAWSILLFLFSLFLIEYLNAFQLSSYGHKSTQRLWSAFVSLQSKYIFLLRNRRTNKITLSEFTLLFIVLFSTITGCYWIVSGQFDFSFNLKEFLYIYPCVLLTISTFFLEIRSEHQKRRTKLHQLAKKILIYGLTVTTISSFNVVNPILDSLIDTVLMISVVSFFFYFFSLFTLSNNSLPNLK